MAARFSEIPFICFTDDPALQSRSWDIRPFSPLLPGDPVRSQRAAKLLAHRMVPEFERSLYIDNSVVLRLTPEQLFAAVTLATGLALPGHSFRASVADEFAEVSVLSLDDPARLAEQLRHYQANCPEILHERPYWSAILLRAHHRPEIITAMEIWLAHILRYSRRDQLSCNAAFRQAGLRPEVLALDNHSSLYHVWPVTEGRQEQMRRWQRPGSAEGCEGD